MLLIISSVGRTIQMFMEFDDQVAREKNQTDLRQLRVIQVKEEDGKLSQKDHHKGKWFLLSENIREGVAGSTGVRKMCYDL